MSLPYSNITLATFSRSFTTFSIELPEAINPKSSTNDKDVTSGLISDTLSKTPLIYIKNRISDIGEPCGIPISISLFLFLYLLIIN